MAAQDDVALGERQRFAGRDAHLLAHDVDPGHHLRDRVLDLHPGVHLQEVVRAVRGQESLDRPRRAVADGPRGLDGDLADLRAQVVVDGGRRRLLDELLVAPLDRAVALAEVDDVAVVVGEDLHLDVAGILEVALDVHRRVGEVRLPLAPRGLVRPLDLFGRARDLEPFAAAARRGLDRDRVTDLLGGGATSSTLAAGSVVPGTIGTPAARMRSRAAIFEPIASIASGGGPIQTSPASATWRAKSAFSARKP